LGKREAKGKNIWKFKKGGQEGQGGSGVVGKGRGAKKYREKRTRECYTWGEGQRY